MTDRVARLRQQSLDQTPTLSTERAELMTAFYAAAPAAPLPILRALSFQYLMERKALCILPGELIVGERGPEPKATPTYPELCCHTLEDLDILDSREKISFAVGRHARDAYRDTVIPYWRERSMRHRMFQELPDAWKHAYEAGVFTEFMEQRAPGHTVADGKIYEIGLSGLQAEVDRELAALDDLNDLRAYDKRQQLKGMRMAADAVILFARRHAAEAARLAADETDPARRAELEQVASICAHVPEHPARTFWEALQAYWFVHLGVITELNTWDSFCPGRLDQHLYPYYKREIAAGALTRERAKELLQCFWVKFNNQPAPPKVGVTAAESGTYTDFSNISNGGLKADGSDGVNTAATASTTSRT
jgi:trans-4-hydroxy-L-proline dehydratase